MANALAAGFLVYDSQSGTLRPRLATLPRRNKAGDAFIQVEATDFPRLLLIQQ